MGDATSIEWTDASWNALRGCSRTIAPGAETSGCGDPTGGGCYAERNGYRFAAPGLPYAGLVRMTPKGARWTGEVRLIDKHLLDPIRWDRPRKIFTTSVSDPFHERFSNEAIAISYGVMAVTRRHTHQLLTKRLRPAREWYAWLEREAAAANGGRGMSPAAFCFCTLQKYVEHDRREAFTESERKLLSRAELVDEALCAPWPLPNLWLVASTEHQLAADDRVPDLLGIRAEVRGLSCEPLLGAIDLTRAGSNWLKPSMRPGQPAVHDGNTVGWVVIGAESGPRARPADLAWFRSLVAQCDAAGVPVFVKQLVINGKLTKELSEFPTDLQRREFPR